MFMCSKTLTAICNFLYACTTVYYSPLMIVFFPRDRISSLSWFLAVCDLDGREVRREVRTRASHCDPPRYLYRLHFS